jgi:antitoxin Phd
MTSPDRDCWQIQDAKQRFSEMIRAVVHEGPQVITRHGEEVAVVVDIAEYRRLTRSAVDLTGLLLGGPKLPDAAVEALTEVEAERNSDFGRPVHLEAGW